MKGQALLLCTLVTVALLSLLPVTVGIADNAHPVIGYQTLPHSMYNMADTVIKLNSSNDESVVAAYPINTSIVIITTQRIVTVNADDLNESTSTTIPAGRVIVVSYNGRGTVYLASYIGGEGSTLVYAYRVNKGLVKVAVIPGYPWDIDSKDGYIALVVHAPGKGLQVWELAGHGKWNATIPGDIIDPDLASYMKVAVSSQGYAAFYAGGEGFEAVLVYNGTGRVVYKKTFKNLYSMGRYYSLAAWSPDGRALAVLSYSETEQNYKLEVLNATTWKHIWSMSVEDPVNPVEGLVFNPAGCCLYYQYAAGSYMVVNATSGSIIGYGGWEPVVTRIYGWTSNGAWSVLARVGNLRGLAFIGMLGSPLITFEYDPLMWSVGDRAVNVPPVNAGFLGDGRVWLVQVYGGEARVAVIDWPKYAIAYFDPGPFRDYYKGITVRDEAGGQWNGWLVPLIPAGSVSLSYTLHARTSMWVTTIWGTQGLIVGDPQTVEEVHWNALLTVKPLEFLHVRIDKEAASLVSHIVLQIPPPCNLEKLEVKWSTGSYTISNTEKHKVTLVALRGTYNLTTTFNPENILYGPIEPTRLHLTVTGGENTTIQLLPQAIVLMIRGGQHAYLVANGHEKYLPVTENWTGYCIAPGDYKLVIRPSMIGAILAPKHWNITMNLTGKSKIVWVDTDKLVEGKLANLEVVNTASQTYTVEFYVKTRDGYQPIVGYNIPGGHTLRLKIIVGLHYKGVYYEKGSNTAEGSFEFTAHQPGYTVTVKIPGQGQATHTTTTTGAAPSGGVHHAQNPTAKTGKTASPPSKPATTTGKRGHSGTAALALGIGIIVVLGLILLALKR